MPVFDLFPGVACATGRILPKWETEPPSWVLRHCLNVSLGLQMRPELLIVSDEDVGVYSGHEAVLRDVFIRSGGFNPDIVKGETVGDNEVGLNRKVKQLGYRFAYVRDAVTHHVIPATRLTQAHLNKFMAHQGSFECYAWYRRRKPSASRFVLGMAEQLSGMGSVGLRSVVRLLLGRDSWHIQWAETYYYASRMTCCWRLLRDDRRRQLVLKDDWLEE